MKRILRWCFVLMVCFCVMSQTAYAAENLTVSHSSVDEEGLIVYVQNPGEYDSVQCQIGQTYSEQVEVHALTDTEMPVDTYILIDNSLSIQEQYRDTIKQIANGILKTKKENERFTVATFDTELHYLVEKSDDVEALAESVNQITFQNLDTNVIDVLYSLYEKIESENDAFCRIIVMSDGMETKTVGYTREELMDRVEANGFPVYMLGCKSDSNETELENMFRISRATNAVYYQLETIESAEQAAAGLEENFDFVQVKAVIPEAQQDGAAKGIKLTFQYGETEKTASFSMDMPFYEPEIEQSEAEHGEEDAAADVQDETSDSAENGELAEASETQRAFPLSTGLIISIGIGVILIVTIVLVYVKKKKKSSTSEEKTEDTDDKTEFLGDNRTEIIEDDDETGMVDFINIRLTDIKKPSQIQEYSLDTSLVVGRIPGKSQIVFDYERSISARHCELYREDDKVFVRDLDSANGTSVDGIPVSEPVELSDGSIIKIGRLQLEFRILQR